MNEKNVKMPDSLLVANVQSSLRQLIQAYQLPPYLWQLIIKDLYHEVNTMYTSQLVNEKDEYERRVKESQSQEEQQNENICER